MMSTARKERVSGTAELIRLNEYPVRDVLPELLADKTNGGNISFGAGNAEKERVSAEMLPGKEPVPDIRPRVLKEQEKQLERTRKNAEVFTPLWVVRKMTELADAELRKTEKYREWQGYVGAKVLELTCGEAPFLVTRYDAVSGEPVPLYERTGMLDRKLRAIKAGSAGEWTEWAYRAYEAVFGYELSGDNLLIARVNLLITFCDCMEELWHRRASENELLRLADIIVGNLLQKDGLAKTGEAHERFDLVIGNPPYQEETTGGSNTAPPVYHLFMEEAYRVSDRVVLITPARFLFNAGYTPKTWNGKMLGDPHFKVVSYYPDPREVFGEAEIKGGVAITYRDENSDFGAVGTFMRSDILGSILCKVTERKDFVSMSDIVVTSFAYHFTPLMYDENPALADRASKGHRYDLQSNTFEKYPEIFSEKPLKDRENIRILGRSRNERRYRYIDRRYVNEVSNLGRYKVFMPKAGGRGMFGEPLPEPVIGLPGDGATVTFTGIGSFGTAAEAENCARYIRTKFARALLGVLKVTQELTPAKWRYVPVQDFGAGSFIGQCGTDAQLDVMLYEKYGLTAEEREFIERNVK